MRTAPPFEPTPLRAPKADEALEGLVGGHLAARALQRKILIVASVAGLLGIALLATVLIPHASDLIGSP